MVAAQEHEEIEYLKRMFRRYVYDFTRQKAQDRTIRGKNGTAISTPRI
jgi:hypothetical protein